MKTANETFELLSKLLSEQNLSDMPYKELYEQLFSIIRQDLSIQLNNSTYPDKSKMISELKKVLGGVEILTQFPELIGKTVVGIMGTAGAVNNALLDRISVQQKVKIYKYGNNVPAIIYNKDEENIIKAVNIAGNTVDLNIEDFKSANQELYKRKIDIRQFLFTFSISAKIPYSNIVYILFPYYSLKSSGYYDDLFNLVDIVMLPVDEEEKWKSNLNNLKINPKNKTVKIIAPAEKIDNVRNYFEETNSNNIAVERENADDICITENEINDYLKSINLARNNVLISEKILGITSKFNVYQTQRQEKLNSIIGDMNRDIFNIDDKDTAESLKQIRSELEKSLDNEKKSCANFASIIDKLRELIDQFEKSLCKAANISEEKITASNILYHDPIEEIYSELIMDLIQIGDINLARNYIEKLEGLNYPFTYIFELYIESRQGGMLSYKNIGELKYENEINNMVSKAKVKYGKELNLSLEQIAGYAKSIRGSLDGYENYILGNYYSTKDINKADGFYRNAMEKGYLDAGDKIILNQNMTNYYEMEKLANMLVPEANYIYGIHCLENNQYAYGVTRLKIAAVFKHVKAIHKLADIEYDKVKKNRDNSKAMNIAKNLYKYLIDNNTNDTDAREKLGQVYYWNEEYRKAKELLETCTTANALFLCGKMYQYGNGTAQDIYKAKDYFKSALDKDKDHKYAKVDYEKVCGWIDSKNKMKMPKGDYRPRISREPIEHDSGWCFITTATCLAIGKEDNCEEIMVFKRYRDEHLIFDEDGAALIREYYKLAPSIIFEIEQETEPNYIYRKLYNDYITVVYEYIKKNDYANAKATYIAMVKDLCSRYNIDAN